MTIDELFVPLCAVNEVIFEAEQIGLDLAGLTAPWGHS